MSQSTESGWLPLLDIKKAIKDGITIERMDQWIGAFKRFEKAGFCQ